MISFNTRTLTHTLAPLFPTRVYAGGLTERVPCEILRITQTNEYQIPKEPVESNVFISDYIYQNPITLEVELYVHEDDIEDFEAILDEYQYHEEGFIVVDPNDKVYDNLRIVTFENEINSDMQAAALYTIEFIEVLRVESEEVIYTPIAPPPAAAAPVSEVGMKNAPEMAQLGELDKLLKSFGEGAQAGGSLPESVLFNYDTAHGDVLTKMVTPTVTPIN